MSKFTVENDSIEKTIKRVALSNGGKIEIELNSKDNGHVRIQLSQPSTLLTYDTSAYLTIGTDKQNIKLLEELRDAIDALLGDITE